VAQATRRFTSDSLAELPAPGRTPRRCLCRKATPLLLTTDCGGSLWLARTRTHRVQEAPALWPPPDHRPDFPARVPRCGHGCRTLGNRKVEKAAAA
jgi:hypothetical protein